MVTEDMFWGRVDKSGGADACWPWTGGKLASGGYGQCSLGHPSKRAHVAAWCYAHKRKRAPKGKFIMHACDNPPCCNPAHLSPGTRLDNIRDMFAKGRGRPYGDKRAKGEENHAKLTERKVRMIVLMSERGVRNKHLSRLFGVVPSTISSITSKYLWKHLWS